MTFHVSFYRFYVQPAQIYRYIHVYKCYVCIFSYHNDQKNLREKKINSRSVVNEIPITLTDITHTHKTQRSQIIQIDIFC